MLKRAAVTFLWFNAMWVAGATFGFAVGLPALGPIAALAGAAFVGVDPRGLFWARPATNPNPRVATRLASMTNVEGAR